MISKTNVTERKTDGIMQDYTQYTDVIDITEYDYMGQKLYHRDNHWVIAGIEKKFKTCLEAERYIRRVLNKAKPQETGTYTINGEFTPFEAL